MSDTIETSNFECEFDNASVSSEDSNSNNDVQKKSSRKCQKGPNKWKQNIQEAKHQKSDCYVSTPTKNKSWIERTVLESNFALTVADSNAIRSMIVTGRKFSLTIIPWIKQWKLHLQLDKIRSAYKNSLQLKNRRVAIKFEVNSDDGKRRVCKEAFYWI